MSHALLSLGNSDNQLHSMQVLFAGPRLKNRLLPGGHQFHTSSYSNHNDTCPSTPSDSRSLPGLHRTAAKIWKSPATQFNTVHSPNRLKNPSVYHNDDNTSMASNPPVRGVDLSVATATSRTMDNTSFNSPQPISETTVKESDIFRRYSKQTFSFGTYHFGGSRSVYQGPINHDLVPGVSCIPSVTSQEKEPLHLNGNRLIDNTEDFDIPAELEEHFLQLREFIEFEDDTSSAYSTDDVGRWSISSCTTLSVSHSSTKHFSSLTSYDLEENVRPLQIEKRQNNNQESITTGGRDNGLKYQATTPEDQFMQEVLDLLRQTNQDDSGENVRSVFTRKPTWPSEKRASTAYSALEMRESIWSAHKTLRPSVFHEDLYDWIAVELVTDKNYNHWSDVLNLDDYSE